MFIGGIFFAEDIHLKIKEIIDSGEMGRIFSVRIRTRMGAKSEGCIDSTWATRYRFSKRESGRRCYNGLESRY